MDKYQSIDNLKSLAKKCIINTVETDELFNFLKEANERNDFSDKEKNFYYLVIILSVEDLTSKNYLLKTLFNELKSKIVLDLIDSDQESQDLENKPTSEAKEEKTVSSELYENQEKDSMESIKRYFLEQFTDFPPNENPNLSYPVGDELGNVQIPHVEYKDGRVFNLNLLIDSTGKVIRFREDPIELKKAADYDSIYTNLVGRIMEFQKA